MYGLAWSWNRWAVRSPRRLLDPPLSPVSPVSPIPFLSPFSGAAFLTAVPPPLRVRRSPSLHPDLRLHRPAVSATAAAVATRSRPPKPAAAAPESGGGRIRSRRSRGRRPLDSCVTVATEDGGRRIRVGSFLPRLLTAWICRWDGGSCAAARAGERKTSTTRNLRLAIDGTGTNNQTRTWRSFWKIMLVHVKKTSQMMPKRKAADSLPENVVVGMNFSLIDPWNSALKCAHKRSGSSSRRTGDVMRQE
uniref:Uncharacterized protein n=1 Tax=Oryza glumipatula TaxID=40148 RepID=A0A0D9Y8N3_9ORYZ